MTRSWLPVTCVPVVATVVVVGVWLTGGVVTDDGGLARTLTAAWFAVAGLVASGIAWRARRLAVPVLATWFVTTATVGGFLLLTSSVDRVVDEHVVVASAGPAAPSTQEGPTSEPVPVLLASGRFRSGAHPTTGVVSVVRRPGGAVVVTLTRFATSPGPDLRLLVLRPGGGLDDAMDLGRLKGNKGDQQYTLLRSARAGEVVVWCRAFSVAFGSAPLHPTG